MNEYGAWLSAERRARGMTQEQLAQLLHVSRQTVSHWETGRVLPDVVTAQQIAQVLGDGAPVEAEAAGENWPTVEAGVAPAERVFRLHPAGWIAIGAGITLLLVAAIVLLLVLTHGPQQTGSSAQALIVVTPSTEAAYLQERPDIAPGWIGWDVDFSYQNVSDVPFTPYGIILHFYRNEELLSEFHVDAGYLVPHMGSSKLIRGNHPLRWPVGNTDLNATRLECIIYGVDDNGNELSFSADVHYINAFEP